ncbi:MAG: hypothetical protein ACOZNI_08850 [Myxococcota bacterium]
MAVTVAVSLTVLLGFGALAVDLGWGRLVDQQLQFAVDAAAHAGTVQLDGTDAGLSRARASALAVGGAHEVGGSALQLADADVEVGVYADGAFTPSNQASAVNAVRVNGARTGLGLFFAPAVGRSSLDVGATATMVAEVGGAREADCFLPVAVPSCLITAHAGLDNLQTVEFKLNPAGIDNLGWAIPNGSANASAIRSQIANTCGSAPATIGDPISLSNGSISSALSDLATAVNASSSTWDTSLWGALPSRMAGSAISTTKYGRTLEGVVAVFDGGSSYCSPSAPWNGTRTIVGFMWGAVFDVKTSGGAADRTIKMRIDVTGSRGDRAGSDGGGPDWGVTAESPPHMIVD